MKKALVFISGFICGVVCMILLGLVINYAEDNSIIPGLTFSEEGGKCIHRSNATVFQMINRKNALVYRGSDYLNSRGELMLLITNGEKLFYDREKIYLPKGKCFMQVGVYQYKTKADTYLTVPAVRMDNI